MPFLNNFLKKNFIYCVVFLTGAAVLMVEVLALRVLAPYYGNTIFTFSSVISTILAALSFGYYLGGRWADKDPSANTFYTLIALSGFSLIFLHLLSRFFLEKWGYKLSMLSGPLWVSLVFFFLPAAFLGMLSPFAFKLQYLKYPEEGMGHTAGLVFFFSTVGSILGSLATGFWLIPHFGVDHLMWGVAYALFLLGSLGCFWLKKSVKLALIILLVLLIFPLWKTLNLTFKSSEFIEQKVLFEKDGRYEKISVLDQKLTPQMPWIRVLRLDQGMHSAIILENGALAIPYTQYYQIYPAFIPKLRRALFLGGGAYSIPKKILEENQDVIVDVAEVEPLLINLAQQYFGLDKSERLNNYILDGRRFLSETSEKYDFIFGDAYASFAAMPAHMATKEFFNLVYQHLQSEGIFMGNFIGSLSPEGGPLIFSIVKTLQQIFPQVYVFAVLDANSERAQNFIVVGYKSLQKIDFTEKKFSDSPLDLFKNLNTHLIDMRAEDLSNAPLLTDEYAPVEYFTGQIIHKYVAEQQK